MDLEAKKALEKYGHFNSTHEVYGVLFEEVCEFFDVVREKPNTPRKSERMIEELKQIRSIADRAIQEIETNKIKWI